jgi:hypothetical protein
MARLPRLRTVIAGRVIEDEAHQQRRQSLARWRWQRPPFRRRCRAAAAPRSEQIELLRPASTVVSKLPLASHGPLPDSGRERPLLLPKHEHSMMRAQLRRPRSPSHQAIAATPEAWRYPPEGTPQPALARKPTGRTHPNRQFQQPTRRPVVLAAAGHIARRLLDHLMDMNDASCPWMPRIKDLTLLGPMGVLSSRCTIAAGRIRALTAPHPFKLTSIRCQSAWQPNPGRRSTYRCGKAVQTTGATSEFLKAQFFVA